MIIVEAASLIKNFREYQDVASREPVGITIDGCERLVLLSADEYKRLKRRDRRVLGRADFTGDELAAIAASQPPAEASQFNYEVE